MGDSRSGRKRGVADVVVNGFGGIDWQLDGTETADRPPGIPWVPCASIGVMVGEQGWLGRGENRLWRINYIVLVPDVVIQLPGIVLGHVSGEEQEGFPEVGGRRAAAEKD